MKHDEQLFTSLAEKIVHFLSATNIEKESAEDFAQIICKACREYAEIVNADLSDQISKIADIVDDSPALNMNSYSDGQVWAINSAISHIRAVVGECQEFVE